MSHLGAALSPNRLQIIESLRDGAELQKQLSDYQVEFTQAGNMTMNASEIGTEKGPRVIFYNPILKICASIFSMPFSSSLTLSISDLGSISCFIAIEV